MVSNFIVHTILLVGFCGALVVAGLIWLWKRKSATDREAYREVQHSERVETFYSAEAYAEASARKDAEES